MIKRVLLLAALAALALAYGCNKQPAVKLDYSEKMKEGLYAPTGLPGDATIGRTAEEDRLHGYHDAEQPGATKPDEKKPDQGEPEEKPPEGAKPEDKSGDQPVSPKPADPGAGSE